MPGYKGEGGGEALYSLDGLPNPREKQVWPAGGIKEAFGYDFDRRSWSLSESHTAAPQGCVLITSCQRCPTRDVGRE